MAAKHLTLSVALTALMGSAALAQVQAPAAETDPRFAPRVYGSYAVTGVDYGQGATVTQDMTTTRIVEPVTPDIQTVISAPVTYSETGVVKAQHFKQGDLSAEEYAAITAEADRIRAYQSTTETYVNTSQSTVSNAGTYEIELFAEPLPAETTTSAAVTSSQVITTHKVVKGDTLYNISKRYNVTVDALQNYNGLYGNTIGLGQVLTIPSSTTIISENTYVAPVTMASTTLPVTRVRNVEPIPGHSSGIYAVLPKDTLYSISRRACVKVADLISVNGISNPNTLQPGQRLTMPAGHCLN